MELVTALVCTRNRSGAIPRAVSSLLADPQEHLELIVMDQSDGPETERALEPFRGDARLRYVHTQTRGKGKALNEGFRLARGDVVVCTDDDCEAPRHWATDMARQLRDHPSAAILFCRVIPVSHDRSKGYVPAYELRESRLLRSIAAARNGLGLGAGMAVRREFVLAIGGFDEQFGPGGRFPSADEWDLSLRALLRGRHVYETAELSILHDGFRSFEEGRTHTRRDWIALGAVCAKPLRAGYLRAAIVPLWFFPTQALWPPIADLLKMRSPRGVVRILSFIDGFAQGLKQPVDPDTLRFAQADQR